MGTSKPREMRQNAPVVQDTSGTKRGRLTCVKRRQSDGGRDAAVSAAAQNRSTGPAGRGCQEAEGQGRFSGYYTAA